MFRISYNLIYNRKKKTKMNRRITVLVRPKLNTSSLCLTRTQQQSIISDNLTRIIFTFFFLVENEIAGLTRNVPVLYLIFYTRSFIFCSNFFPDEVVTSNECKPVIKIGIIIIIIHYHILS